MLNLMVNLILRSSDQRNVRSNCKPIKSLFSNSNRVHPIYECVKEKKKTRPIIPHFNCNYQTNHVKKLIFLFF